MDDLLKFDKENTDEELKQFIEPFREEIIKKVNIVDKKLYPNWIEYRLDFLKYGGIIEAVPPVEFNKIKTVSSHMLIEPNGNIDIVGTQEQVRY